MERALELSICDSALLPWTSQNKRAFFIAKNLTLVKGPEPPILTPVIQFNRVNFEKI